MSVEIWRDNGLDSVSKSTSFECFNQEQMQMVLYVLLNKECINIVPDDYRATSTLILLEGELMVYSSGEPYSLKKHDSVMFVDIEESYYAEAVGFAKLMAVTSVANQDVLEDKAVSDMMTEVEKKDVYTLGHSRRVSLYAKRLALALKPSYDVINLSVAASMHDIGKIETPVEILQKPGRLTEEEMQTIQLHPLSSYNILKGILGEKAAIAAKQHHERLDGSGYPEGLSGDDICMDAKIIAVADVFDAMTCKRIYNEPSPPMSVVKMLEESSDKYDPVIVAILRKKVESGELDDILTAFVAP